MADSLPQTKVSTQRPEMNLAEFIIRVEAEKANVDIELVRRAYEFSDGAHHGQKRESGEPYLNHCVAVAMILAEQRLDSATIAAGLIHDVVEDTPYGLEAIRTRFGEEIAQLVDGVTKIGGVKYQSRAELQAEYFRKMLLSMAQDIRVIIIKLADRLHNMRTLKSLAPDRRKRIAEETRDVYAPLAHRFGMARLKWELEDLALQHLQPEVYDDLHRKVELTREERDAYIEEVKKPLTEALVGEGITATITGRAKHFDSIYRKMIKRDKKFEEITDLIAIRVITNSERDCYHTLGVVHTLWTPVGDRFHDYIATPKTNMYQSLHTTVIGPRGRMVEIQIRTHEMHYAAEYGIAAHWLYKEGKRELDHSDRQMSWLREVLEWQKETHDPKEFLDFFKTDLFQDEIYVFTPKGDLLPLPRGATPIDFAYAVHSEIGHRCIGSRVNGRIVPLPHELASGDEVEIITGTHANPSRDWLSIASTARARAKIRQFLRKTGYEQSLELGRDILTRELKRLHFPMPSDTEMTDLAMSLSFPDTDSMIAALGSGTLSIIVLRHRLVPETAVQKRTSVVQRFVDRARRPHGIKIQNMDNMMFRFANCCQPVPGEKIVGFITRGRGVTVHSANCVNVASADDNPERRLAVEWDVMSDQVFLVRLVLGLENRKNLLRDVTQAISETETNICSASVDGDRSTGTGQFVIQVKNLRHLNEVVRKIRGVPGVLSVERSSDRQGMDEGTDAAADRPT
ncbi:MAG: bifunctional (p)ppGpp synthetase/guanosine-3',5'-bis(diphosphate) 3'-pyrophosphohydrolase [candidate division Zixibacteria bacterium]|nr:bifunctional (p)ppGpp synthetase/guanosine-3',5'-bis(diphosphate) 3'-pyrophosphohydrolase [candidate division Zixibacteria bacterium]